VPLLADHFGRRMAVELDWTNWPGFTPRALAELDAYPWPGNVRELRNVIERAVYRHEDPERSIDVINFNPFHSPWAPTGGQGVSVATAEVQESEAEQPLAPAPAAAPSATHDFRAAVADYEHQILEDALRRNRFNQRATAAALNLSYDQLRHALKRHKLQDSAG
jgi:psp operon transcriptional activator